MAIFAPASIGVSDPMRAQSIKALEARAQALAQQNAQQQMPTSVPSPWQGVSNVFNTAADAMIAKQADRAAAQRRQDLAGYISNLGDNPTMAQLGPIMAADSDVGKTIMGEIQARRLAAQKAADDQAYLVKSDQLQQAHPQTAEGKLKADLDAGRMSQEAYDAAMKKLTMGSPADQAAIGKAQQENIDLQGTNAALDEADKLLKSGKVYSGDTSYFPGLKTDYGQAVPEALRGVLGVSKEQTDASQRYKQILSEEVVQTLKRLKGPASNKDMDWATGTINNPSASLENKQRALAMLRAQMAAHLQSSQQTLENMGGKVVNVETPGTTATADPLAKARAAIAAGAPRDAVIKRLQDAGIDTKGL